MADRNSGGFFKRFGGRRTVGAIVLVVAAVALSGAAYLLPRRDVITPPATSAVYLRSPETDVAGPTALPPVSRLGVGPSFAVLGDSYAASQGASDLTKGWVELLARGMCWNLVKNAAQGGTGYTTAGLRPGAAPFAARVQSVIDAKPNIVFVEGGGNDYAAGPEDLYNAAMNVFAKLRDGLGEVANIVAIGPIPTPKKSADELISTSQAIASAANDSGVMFVDPFVEAWTVDPLYFVADGSHLNDAGYAQFANRLIDDIHRLTVSAPGTGCPTSA